MMTHRQLHKPLLAALVGAGILLAPLGGWAYEDELFSLKNRWEHTTTQIDDSSERRDTLGALAEEAEALAEENASEADVLVWQGIILASYARERGGLGALGSAKDARSVLERAIELDPQGGNGSAYVTLGALYDRAPGRPLGFGNSETAERMFQRALEIRPNGIDTNFYYAAYLKEEGREDEARDHARRAVEGEAREGRQASDEALRGEAETLLNSL